MQHSTATVRHGVTRKRSMKRLKRNMFRNNLQLKGKVHQFAYDTLIFYV